MTKEQYQEWNRAVRYYAKGTRVAVAAAIGIVERLELEGVTEIEVNHPPAVGKMVGRNDGTESENRMYE